MKPVTGITLAEDSILKTIEAVRGPSIIGNLFIMFITGEFYETEYTVNRNILKGLPSIRNTSYAIFTLHSSNIWRYNQFEQYGLNVQVKNQGDGQTILMTGSDMGNKEAWYSGVIMYPVY